MQEKLDPQLEQLKIKQKDILNAELLVEEIFWSLIKKGNAAQVKVQVVKNFFGSVQVQMTAEGMPYSPLVEIADWEEDKDDEDYFSLMILKANLQRLNWFHKNNFNVVTINVRSKGNSQALLTIAGIVGGLIVGVVMREFLSPETISFINETIIKPPEEMFLNALSLLIAPVVFFSILNGIIGMGTSAGVGKISLKLMGFSPSTMLAALIISSIMTGIFFSGDVPLINTLPTAEEAAADGFQFSLIKFIVDIIPGDFVSPILNGKVLQIIFVSILFGISLNALGNKVALFKELVGNLNDIFTKMISLVILFVPLIALFAMITLALELNAATVMIISKLLIGQLVAALMMFGFFLIFIWHVGKISVKPFTKKILALMPMTFATSSSNAVMPSMMNLCTDKFGISSKISSFAIPLGTSGLSLTGPVIYVVTSGIMFVRMYNIELDLQTAALIAFLSMTISLGAPAVPATLVICVVTIVGYFGVPKEIATLMFCLDALSDRIASCVSVVNNMAVTTALARSENLLDEKIYFME